MPGASVGSVTGRDPYSDEEMSCMAAPNYCESCGAECPTFAENGMEIYTEEEMLCDECSREVHGAGYSIEGTSDLYKDYP